MKRKFKVGDRVKCVDNGGWQKPIVGKYGTVTRISDNGYGVEFDEHISGHSCMGSAKDGYGWHCYEEMLELAKNETIVIYRKGDEVIALDKVSGKTGVAKCGRKDTFDFATGARIAFDRLLGDPKPEEPEYFAGKVVCINSRNGFISKGTIYEFNNGFSLDNVGNLFPYSYPDDPVKDLDELNKRMVSDFIEIKEDPKPEEPEKTPLNVKIVFTKGDGTFKTGHIYEIKDGKLKSPNTSLLFPDFPRENFTKFYSVAELEDYFKCRKDRKLHSGGWNDETLEFIVIEED